ncbi:MAG TPA: hypothetical protein PK747_01695 [Acidobacteriota bacterium]|nr:hypothetical protein [Acidobacteriota bacterium]HNT17062.1 hypothetical protein [Acidobacteriota bacterium]HQQ46105.1 hypothetical protein [Acidobacteriota bacterium]
MRSGVLGAGTLLVIILIGVLSADFQAQEPGKKLEANMEPLPREVAGYLEAMDKFECSETHETMEPLFNMARAAGRSLMNPNPSKESSYLERVDEKLYQSFRKQMRGLVVEEVGGDYAPQAYPDYQYFLRLAIKKGLEEDVDFFQLIQDYGPYYLQDMWANTNGCTKYIVLRNAYERFAKYRNRHPNSYQEALIEEMRKIGWEFAICTCVCEDRHEGTREFFAFLELPQYGELDLNTRKFLREIGDELKSGTSKIKFNCKQSNRWGPYH